jgi:2-methylcitrate dehydratase
MDQTTRRLVDFAQGFDGAMLDAGALHECKRRLIDTFACAMGAYDEPLSVKARALAGRYAGIPSATVWGSGAQTAPEMAAFTNGVMLRFLDLSDTYLGKGGSHPSDVISGILAVGETVHADGPSVLAALALAYDAYCSLNDAVDIGAQGWDQPLYTVVGTVLGAGMLMGLSTAQLGNAVSLAVTPNLSLRESRYGDLSNWKGCAGANAARNAVFAAVLAQSGFSGPPAVFEGKAGLWNILGKFDWPLPERNGPRMVAKTHIKSLPLCYHGQSAALCALALRPHAAVNAIREIRVETYRTAVAMMGGDAGRWAPTTRETADHSLPYVIAVALLDGAVTMRSFTSERLGDPAIARIMRKVKVGEDAALTAAYPAAAPARVTILLDSGAVLTQEIQLPTGHARNPVDDAAMDAKFRDLLRGHADDEGCTLLLQSLWNFEKVRDIRSITAAFALHAKPSNQPRSTECNP